MNRDDSGKDDTLKPELHSITKPVFVGNLSFSRLGTTIKFEYLHNKSGLLILTLRTKRKS